MKLQLTLIAVLFIEAAFCFDYPRNVKDLFELTHDPDVLRNVTELITSKGYLVEEHTVQTQDGFLLSVQRIPRGRKQLKICNRRPVVLLQHGLISASSDWVLNFPNQSLAFILADSCYDVWLGNARGNVYSRHHVKLKPSMSEFWNFSFNEMAEYDLPAMIDYALNQTNQKQLIYIGHSQGTTAAFALLTQSPLYNQKIKLFVALAPVATVGYITNPVVYFAPLGIDFDWLLELLGVNEFLPSSALLKYLTKTICESKERIICDDIMFMLLGWDKKQINETRLPVYIAHYPSGSSTKSVIHYAQMAESKKFQKFDYGKRNMDYYNQTKPPEYDLSKITTPVALLWARNDGFADFVDVSLLERRLKSLVVSYCVPNGDFNHGDFIMAVEARKLLYDEVLLLLQKYNNLF